LNIFVWDAITGDAISGLYWYCRRDMFNWWLIEVIPAASIVYSYHLLYVLKMGFLNPESVLAVTKSNWYSLISY
jgi:hypothetical protein